MRGAGQLLLVLARAFRHEGLPPLLPVSACQCCACPGAAGLEVSVKYGAGLAFTPYCTTVEWLGDPSGLVPPSEGPAQVGPGAPLVLARYLGTKASLCPSHASLRLQCPQAHTLFLPWAHFTPPAGPRPAPRWTARCACPWGCARLPAVARPGPGAGACAHSRPRPGWRR